MFYFIFGAMSVAFKQFVFWKCTVKYQRMEGLFTKKKGNGKS